MNEINLTKQYKIKGNWRDVVGFRHRISWVNLVEKYVGIPIDRIQLSTYHATETADVFYTCYFYRECVTVSGDMLEPVFPVFIDD